MSAIHFHQNERGTIDSGACEVVECPRLIGAPHGVQRIQRPYWPMVMTDGSHEHFCTACQSFYWHTGPTCDLRGKFNRSCADCR